MSSDQVKVNNPGWLSTGYGKEYYSSSFCWGTIYNYAYIVILCVENQVSLGASETVLGYESFEKLIWERACVEISHMHSDNGIFASSQFRLDYDNKHKEKYFSGVGAQYQNSRLERSIQTW